MQFANTVVVFEVDVDRADVDQFMITTFFVGGGVGYCWISIVGCACFGSRCVCRCRCMS